ncbi:MAG TPA: hypothetical protein VGN97_18070 [Mesorhizobium sp.]|jgi:hypothetical protein|nr:hypothetical protein [Mesorhizobium sp.]
MRTLKTGLILLAALSGAAQPASGQESETLFSGDGPFVYTLEPDGALQGGQVLGPGGLAQPGGNPQGPCGYDSLPGRDMWAGCPPTTDPSAPSPPPVSPCENGMCPPSVGLGGSIDPESGAPLVDVLPGFSGLGVRVD